MATLQDLKEVFADRPAFQVAIEVSGFTGFRTTLLEELTQDEIDRLFKIHCPEPESLDAEFNALKEELIKKEWRSKILATAEKEGIKEPNSFHKFNNWMLTKSRFKKQLTAHSIDELKELHKQMKALKSNNARSAQRTMTKAWWNKAEQLKNWN